MIDPPERADAGEQPSDLVRADSSPDVIMSSRFCGTTLDIFRVLLRSTMDRHAQMASGMAFDLFLALVPLMALVGWVLSLALRDSAQVMDDLSLWLNWTPQEVQTVVEQHADRFMAGSLAPVVVVGSLWLASGAFASVMAAFETTLPTEARPWWKRRLLALLCVGGLTLALSTGAAVELFVVAQTRGLEQFVPASFPFKRSQSVGLLVSILTIALLIAGFYRIGIQRKVPRRHVWPGTTLCLALATLSSSMLALYARTIATYAVYYGSLAAVAVVLLWLWTLSLAVLLGGELNVYLEEQTLATIRAERQQAHGAN